MSTMRERFWEWQKAHVDNEWTTKQMVDIAAFAESEVRLALQPREQEVLQVVDDSTLMLALYKAHYPESEVTVDYLLNVEPTCSSYKRMADVARELLCPAVQPREQAPGLADDEEELRDEACYAISSRREDDLRGLFAELDRLRALCTSAAKHIRSSTRLLISHGVVEVADDEAQEELRFADELDSLRALVRKLGGEP